MLSRPYLYRRRPILDLSFQETILIVIPLLTINVPVGIAFVFLWATAAIHLHGKGTSGELINRKIGQEDPYNREVLIQFEKLSQRKDAGTISKAEQEELDQIRGQLLLSEPKPWLSLHRYRLDIVAWMGMGCYTFYRLHQLFPGAVEKLFFAK